MTGGGAHDSSTASVAPRLNQQIVLMTNEFDYIITTTRFDEDYSPSESSRITTNFANLARGEHRQQNLRNALTMIDRRFNELADWDNPKGDRYTVELEIITVGLQ